jgi:hypothetical protein
LDRDEGTAALEQNGFASDSLAANLLAAVDARSADVGQISAGEGGSVTIDGGRGIIEVRQNDHHRFGIGMSDGRLRIASGWADSLVGVVDLAAAWKSGASAGEAASAFPFMEFTDLALVLSSQDPVAAQWEWLRAESWPQADRELIEAAHANPVLRGYFPDVSMRLFEFSRSWLDREGSVRVCVLGSDRFAVDRGGGGFFGRGGKGHQRFEYPSLDDAVSVAAEILCGTFAVEPVQLRDAGRGAGVSFDGAGLTYPLDAAGAPLFAQDAVAQSGGALDWSQESLAEVDDQADEALFDMVSGSFGPDHVYARARNWVVGLGTYVGEVLVRNTGARWVDFDEDARESFGHSLGIELSDGTLCSPLGVLFLLCSNDVDDSMTSFYNRVTARH